MVASSSSSANALLPMLTAAPLPFVLEPAAQLAAGGAIVGVGPPAVPTPAAVEALPVLLPVVVPLLPLDVPLAILAVLLPGWVLETVVLDVVDAVVVPTLAVAAPDVLAGALLVAVPEPLVLATTTLVVALPRPDVDPELPLLPHAARSDMPTISVMKYGTLLIVTP
jgi:hypothetical protein